MYLKEEYENKKIEIQSRLNQFKTFHCNSLSWFFQDEKLVLKKVDIKQDQIIFEELVFCILTANTSAVMGLKCVDSLRAVLIEGDEIQINEALVRSGYRYPNIRAKFIIEAREKMKDELGFKIWNKINSFSDNNELREYFISIKGLGFKESSHFLRNIGISGYAILDKHILRCMNEYGIIEEIPKSLTKYKYSEFEKKFHDLSKKLGIDVDELDLLLWSMKNGNILK